MVSKLMVVSLFVFTLFICACKEAENVIPAPPDIHDFSTPVYSTANTTMKLFVNDKAKWTTYVGETFEIKVVLFNMPSNLYAVTTKLTLPSSIMVIDTVIDNGNYFDNSTNTLHAQVNTSNIVEYAKVYLRDKTPAVAPNGVIFKIRCRALTTSVGYISIGGSGSVSETYFRQLGIGETTVTPASDTTRIPFINFGTAELRIRDEFYVPIDN